MQKDTENLRKKHIAHGDESGAHVSRGSGPANRSIGSSQPPFKRQSQAFEAAFEDPLQASREKPASANSLRTEFFDLSPR